MAKVLVMLTALLGTTLAEPPVHSDYLPPQNTQGLSSQYGVPQAQGFGISNYHESTASSSYQPPSNDLSQNSYGRNNAFDNNGNSYESSARDQIFGNLNSDSVSVDVVPHNGFNFRQPSQSYGAPSSYAAPSGNYHDSTQRRFSGQLSNAYGTPSSSPDHSSFGGQSRLRQLVAKYGAPTPSALSSKSRAFSHSFPRATAAANRYTSAITSNTYGVPFNSAFDNTFAALSNTYGVPSNGNDYSQHYSGNAFQGYGRKASTEDPLAVPPKYEYNYEVQAAEESGAEFGHKEFRENESTKGVYHVLLPDGRMQVVEYEADENGYRPKIRYDETGYPNARQSGFNGY